MMTQTSYNSQEVVDQYSHAMQCNSTIKNNIECYAIVQWNTGSGLRRLELAIIILNLDTLTGPKGG